MRIQVGDSVIADGRKDMICPERVNPGREVVELVVQSKALAPYTISCMMKGAGIIPVPISLRR